MMLFRRMAPARCRLAVISTSLCLIGLTVVGGCAGDDQPYMCQQRLANGLVLVLTGMHGRLWMTENIASGIDDGGVDHAIELHDWTNMGVFFPLMNLRAERKNRERAALIAEHVREYQRANPGRPVTLVGYSAGATMAIWTAEALHPDSSVDGIILLSIPVRPDYDLRTALAASRKGIVSFHSERDWIYLGLGTTIAGTMDVQRGTSAGNRGFVRPPAGEDDCYDRLFQVAWRPEMRELGYTGLHLSIGARPFVASYVAPLILAGDWDEESAAAGVSLKASAKPVLPAATADP